MKIEEQLKILVNEIAKLKSDRDFVLDPTRQISESWYEERLLEELDLVPSKRKERR